MENIETNVEEYVMPRIGEDAPSFEAVTTQGKVKFPEDYKGKWVILFSHPADFTPVCTTEFMTFAKMHQEFKDLNVELIGLSIDSIFAHLAWLKRIEEKIEWKGMKNLKIEFPVIEDISMEVARKYGMIAPSQSTTQAVRAVFFIDPKGKVRTTMYYPASLGRNFDEIKRVIQGLQKSDKDKVATPADWRPGEDVIVPAPQTCGGIEERFESKDNGLKCLDWFLCFKEDK